jgi:hypothetical protein
MKEKLLNKIVDYFDNRVKTSCKNTNVDFEITKKLTEKSYFNINDILERFSDYEITDIKEIIDYIDKETIKTIKNIGKDYYRKEEFKGKKVFKI